MKLFFYSVSHKSLYAKLMMHELHDRYEPVFREQGGLADAVACLEAGEAVIVHVQWEEFFFIATKTPKEAEAEADIAEAQLRRISALGGPIIWTIHNALPHQIKHVTQFMRIRRLLAQLADRILVHNNFSRDFLCDQVDVPAADERIMILPHPSYAGMYEPEGETETAVRAPRNVEQKFLLGFGMIRKQKGFDKMFEVLDPDFTRELGIRLRISGLGNEGKELEKAFGHRDDIDWDLAYVPFPDVPALFRSASCLLLPYTHLLTSGVALLVLTLGGIIVAPAMPTFVELLPEPLRRFLYNPDDPSDLRRVVTELLELTPEQEIGYRLAGIEAVKAVHPSLISERLGRIYEREIEKAASNSPIFRDAVEARANVPPIKSGTNLA